MIGVLLLVCACIIYIVLTISLIYLNRVNMRSLRPAEPHKYDDKRAELKRVLNDSIKIHKPFGGYNAYNILGQELVEENSLSKTPFDDVKKVFVIQCSYDGVKYENIEPCAYTSRTKLYIGDPKTAKFPVTLDVAFRIVDMIVRTNAINFYGQTNFKYWRIGINWEAGFSVWFDGKIDGNNIINTDYSVNWGHLNSHIKN